MSDTYISVTDKDFEARVLKSAVPVIVDFWATWCPPCKMLGPIFEKVAGDYAGRVVFAKMNTYENQETPVKYNIRGIPTLLLFKGGKVVAQQVGAVDARALAAFVDKAL
jgi:thioredoxin 1